MNLLSQQVLNIFFQSKIGTKNVLLVYILIVQCIIYLQTKPTLDFGSV